ncbi:MAG: EAL domain-containing protein [Acidobacteriota bacterium]
MKTKLSSKNLSLMLMVFLLVTALLSMISLVHNVYDRTSEYYFDLLNKSQRQESHNLAIILAQTLNSSKQVLITSSIQMSQMDLENEQAVQHFLYVKASGYSVLEETFFIRSSDGRLLLSRSIDGLQSNDNRQISWYRKVMQSRRFEVSEPFLMKEHLVIVLAVPVYKDGEIQGVLGFGRTLDSLQQILKQCTFGQKGYGYVFDNKGYILIHPDENLLGFNLAKPQPQYISKLKLDNEHLRSLSKIGPGTVKLPAGSLKYNNEKGQEINGYYSSVPGWAWKVAVVADADAVADELWEIHKTVIIIIIIGILAIIFGVLLMLPTVRKARYQALHDPRTGLLNRRAFTPAVKDAIQNARKGAGSALFFIVFDNYKMINDTFGHQAAEQIMEELAEALRSGLDESGLLARWEGEEFAALATAADRTEAEAMARHLMDVVEATEFHVSGYDYPVQVRLTIGGVLVEAGAEVRALEAGASFALDNAREKQGRRVACLSIQDISADDVDRVNRVASLIKSALKENRMRLYLQPIVDLTTNEIARYEALVRICTETGVLVQPGEFIPVAEKIGLIVDIDRWVLKSVIEVLKNEPGLTIFVNLSGAGLGDEPSLDFIEHSVRESNIGTSHLGFEITETAAIDNFKLVESWMTRIKELGCKIALDDFGVGYTSFSYLCNLPIDYLKIDGAFIKNIDSDESNRAIVETIATMANALGMETIAEFVENEKVLQVIKNLKPSGNNDTLKINYGQGYHFGKPVPAEEVLSGN